MQFNIFATPEEVAQMLSVSLVTVYRYMKRKKNPLPYYKISNRKLLVRISELEEWVAANTV